MSPRQCTRLEDIPMLSCKNKASLLYQSDFHGRSLLGSRTAKRKECIDREICPVNVVWTTKVNRGVSTILRGRHEFYSAEHVSAGGIERKLDGARRALKS